MQVQGKLGEQKSWVLTAGARVSVMIRDGADVVEGPGSRKFGVLVWLALRRILAEAGLLPLPFSFEPIPGSALSSPAARDDFGGAIVPRSSVLNVWSTLIEEENRGKAMM